MTITELHLLLTYACNLACEHCFVWGSPQQSGTMQLATINRILDQAESLGTVEWIYFEGGEPFLHPGLLLEGVRESSRRGFRVGLVSNAFWATSVEQAVARLRPLAGQVQDLSLSLDDYHGDTGMDGRVQLALRAAQELGIPVDLIRVASPARSDPESGEQDDGESAVRFRGRAAVRLAPFVRHHPPAEFDCCPYEDLSEPGRVHIDPLGYVHVCQGICLGNLLERDLAEIFTEADPGEHPVVGPLLRGGPAELARVNGIAPAPGYADACHFCYLTRCQLRARYPAELGPDQMYGVP